jgi:outer membrane usher protein FimD/PapC
MNANLKTLSIVAVAVIAVLAIAAYGASYYVLYYPNTANIPAGTMIKMYSNAECTTEVTNGTTISWGSVSVGSNTKTYWIKNIGNANVVLSLTNSTMPSGWILSWNYDGTALAPAAVRSVVITLTVPVGATAGTYNWNSWITAQGP